MHQSHDIGETRDHSRRTANDGSRTFEGFASQTMSTETIREQRRSSRDQSNNTSTVTDNQSTTMMVQSFSKSNEMEIDSQSETTVHIPNAVQFDARKVQLLKSAIPKAPVTRETLSELDLNRIMNNINLRMDANFDRDLHFRPDLDGVKGAEKRRRSDEYWQAMALELEIYAFNAMHGRSSLANSLPSFEPRLPGMFETLKDVLMSLVPERDHPAIEAHLDVPFLIQEIERGVLDMLGLANWLSILLKTHCAPMRDEWADKMVQKIEAGSQTQDMNKVVEGLKQLFGIMEVMKLDVANHQIRAFRVLLVEETVPFLRSYFTKKMKTNHFDPTNARKWYRLARRREQQRIDSGSENAPTITYPTATLLRALLVLLVSSKEVEVFPETFHFDDGRLWRARTDLQDLINLEVCGRVFEQLINRLRPGLQAPQQSFLTLRNRLWLLLEPNEDEAYSRDEFRWINYRAMVAREVVRGAYNTCGFDDSAISSECIELVEDILKDEFTSSPKAQWVRGIRASLRERLEQTTMRYAQEYSGLTPLQICEAQASGSSGERNSLAQVAGRMKAARSGHSASPARPAVDPSYASDIDSVARRIAHIGVLHWRVWGNLLYELEEGEVDVTLKEAASMTRQSSANSAASAGFGRPNNAAGEDAADVMSK